MKIDAHCELSLALAVITDEINTECKDAASTVAHFKDHHPGISQEDLTTLVSVLNFEAIRSNVGALGTMLAHVG